MENTTVEDTPTKQKLVKSLINVVNYMTKTVADEVSKKVSAETYGETPQDGFDAVNKVADIMAKSGGKKFKKTRRFSLFNKNKTKRL